jgi:hypothetical protein
MPLPSPLYDSLSRWAHELRSEAALDGWRVIAAAHGHELPEHDPAALGPALVERQIELVTAVLAMRFLHPQEDPALIAQGQRFVTAHAYGLPDEQRDARYALRFVVPGREVELFVRELDEVDLEDLCALYPFNLILLRRLDGEIEEPEAEAITRAVREDLGWSGDPWRVEADLTMEGELVVFVEELDEEDATGGEE